MVFIGRYGVIDKKLATCFMFLSLHCHAVHLLNPHPRMRGPHRPQRDSPGAYAVIIGIPEPRVYLIVHYTTPLNCTTKFFHSGIPMSHNALHYATAASGSVRTPQNVAGDSLTMEWCLQFQHP